MATVAAKDQDIDIQQVWQQYKPDCTDKRLRNILMERYFPLVKYNGELIWQRLPDGVELDDLISAGVFGLMDAIDAFDMSRGVKFETHCVCFWRACLNGLIEFSSKKIKFFIGNFGCLRTGIALST